MKKNKTILFEITCSFLLVITFSSLVLGLYSFNTLGKYINQQIDFYQEQNIKQIGKTLDSYGESIQTAQRILTGMVIEQELFQNGTSTRGRNNALYSRNIENVLRNIRRTSPIISNIFMVYEGGAYTSSSFFSKDVLLQKSWYQEAFLSKENMITTQQHQADYQVFSGEGPYVVSLIKKIISPNDAKTIIGVIMVDLDAGMLKETLDSQNFDDEYLILLCDSEGNIFESTCGGGGNIPDYSQKNINCLEMNPKVEKGCFLEESSVYSYGVSSYGWNLEAMVSKKNLRSQFLIAGGSFTGITFLTLLFSALLSYLLARRITRPIQRLLTNMEDFSIGDFNVRAKEEGNKDIVALSQGFNKMSKRISYLMEDLKIKEHESANARLRELQAQINPHFLYNTLETIRSLAIRNGVESIANMAKSMALIFRYCVNSRDEVVTLRDELNHVKSYINIQKIRYKSRLQVDFQVEEEVLDTCIIKILVQPLVENAIYHGIEQKREGGKISVVCYRSLKGVKIVVEDDGIGMEPEVLNRLQDQLQLCKGRHLGESIGLENVHLRLKLYYGSERGLHIESVYGQGTKVSFEIPFIMYGEEDRCK
ncbi:cache domain-containing sensor histidine kinase [Lachnoanaerobaculum gingivalis]|uniref:cache domain-containing sensor histidine kinase n=1 Tax=Lachnoanaerobaculum gingivalis TaxID=2490855 RepID=UPI0024A6F936|nr:sensor histidine kinase [Lachnoanaerobaculum gingivalis]WHE86937.1 sensor histidine kinase [Lachnoanaerobaculum gingivalis]